MKLENTVSNSIVPVLATLGVAVSAQFAEIYAQQKYEEKKDHHKPTTEQMIQKTKDSLKNVKNNTSTNDTTKTTPIKKSKEELMKFNFPIIDPLIQGLPNDPVKRYCKEVITINPDSLMLQNFKFVPIEKARDYIMHGTNLPKIFGATIATNPEVHIYPGYDFAFNYSSTNVVDFKVMPARNLIDLVYTNPNNTLADKRIIEQIKRNNYRRATTDDTEILQALQHYIKSDATLVKQEFEVITKMMREKGYDRLLVGMIAYHNGTKDVNGKDVKGEAVPQFLLLNAHADTVQVIVPDTTSRGYSGNEKKTGPANTPKKIEKDNGKKISSNNFGVKNITVGVGETEFDKGMLYARLGVGFDDFEVGLKFGHNDGDYTLEIPGSTNSRIYQDKETLAGADISARIIGNLSLGLGATYRWNDFKIDQEVRSARGNIEGYIYGNPLTKLNKATDHVSGTVSLAYKLGIIRIEGGVEISKDHTPKKYAGVGVNF
ncbi:MAG: hypothetical protein ACP5NV_03275 [Candidatus Woesearchaeota archaeon]